MKKRFLILFLCLFIFVTIEPANAYVADGIYLFADDGNGTYLGKVTSNIYDIDSIYNQYGTYGSVYSDKCIFNKYCVYGGEYSVYSPFAKYTATPPIMVFISGGTVISTARLTVNNAIPGAIDPTNLYGALVQLGI